MVKLKELTVDLFILLIILFYFKPVFIKSDNIFVQLFIMLIIGIVVFRVFKSI